MCGAFSVIHPFRDLSQRFNAGYNEHNEHPRFNVRPSQPIPAILNTNSDEIILASWGVHPHYDKTGKMFFINARDDSLDKPTWKKMVREGRCLILADGFYEWQKKSGKTKTPYRFEMKDKGLFAFAGLWHEEEDGPHCVIITTEPNSVVEDVHDRMPAILTKEAEKVWLNPDTDPDEAMALLKPYAASKMHKFAISTLVNSPSNDVAEVILPAKNSA